jgi:Holliday junction resolvase
MTHYARGAHLERQAAVELHDHGWWVARVAGSHGPADLIALHAAHRPWVVQCKIDRRNMRPDEWAHLWAWATELNCIPVLVDRSGPRMTPTFYFMLGNRPRGGAFAEYLSPIDWGTL